MNLDLEWKNSYNIGIAEIDHQHRYFLGIIKRLDTFLRMEDSLDHYKRLLQELAYYALFHFRSEENLMIHTEYPDLEAHQKKRISL